MTEGLSDEEESVLVSLARDDGWGNGWGNEDRNMPSSDGLVGTSSDYATERAPPGDTTTMCAAPNPGGGNDTLTDVDQARAGPLSLAPGPSGNVGGSDDPSNLFEPIVETPKRKTPESSLTPRTDEKRQHTTLTGGLAAMPVARKSSGSVDTLTGVDQAQAGSESVQCYTDPTVSPDTIMIRTIENSHYNRKKEERENYASFEEIRCYNFDEESKRIEIWIMKQRCAGIWIYGSFEPIQYEVYGGKGRKKGRKVRDGTLEAGGSLRVCYNETVCFQSAIHMPGTQIWFKQFYMTQVTGRLKEYFDDREEELHVEKCRQYGIDCSLRMDNNCAVCVDCAVHKGKWPQNKAFILEQFIQESKNRKPLRNQARETEANGEAGRTWDEADAGEILDEAEPVFVGLLASGPLLDGDSLVEFDLDGLDGGLDIEANGEAGGKLDEGEEGEILDEAEPGFEPGFVGLLASGPLLDEADTRDDDDSFGDSLRDLLEDF